MSERLELIKTRLKATKELYNKPVKVTITEEFKDDIAWLIQQAERTEWLQEQLNAKYVMLNKGDEEDRYALQEENIRLSERVMELEGRIKLYNNCIKNLDALADSVRFRINCKQDAEDVADEIINNITELESKVGEIT